MKTWEKALVLFAAALLNAACSEGDGSNTGGTDSGGTDSGGSDAGGTSGSGGTPSGGGTSGSGSGSGSGTGGEFSYGSGTVTADIDGVTVEFEVFQARYLYLDNSISISTDAVEPDGAADGLGINYIGTAAGSVDCTTSVEGQLSIQAPREDGGTGSFQSQGQSSCTITITEYGAVGEAVRGTFSGVVAGSGESKTITNGSFDVIRGTDF